MSRRSAVSGQDREAFIKAQIVSVHKALNKNEVPLKQKHVRVLIVGTHKERSSSVFWNTISRIQLEKNPVLTWKFCHLLHKLIRDGHKRVLEESCRYTARIVQLGNFWQHLHTSGYGLSNTSYCRLLVNRIDFHKRNPSIPGSLQLSETQINTMVNADVNSSFELSIEMLDQMDDLLNLQTTVFNAMDVVRWSSLVPQGQCLLAPLILVVLDTSKLYDYLVKIIFKLHEQVPPDALAGHRERFGGIFIKMKKFYEEANNLQYFKFLVSIPKLPSLAPNFLQASDLDTYQSPQAYLHGDTVSESDTPPDGRSIDELVDVSETQSVQEAPQAMDEKDALIDSLRRDVEDARFNNDRLMNEARSRIEQYENRLLQMKHENDQYKQSVDELKEEVDRVRATSTSESERLAVDEARLHDVEKKAESSEQNFQKMKTAYANLRQEHIEALTKLSNAQKDLVNSESERMNKEESIRGMERKMAEAERERSLVEEKARGAACSVDDLQGQLAQCQVDIENLNKTIEDIKESSTKETNELKEGSEELRRKLEEETGRRNALEEQARTAATSADDLSAQLTAKLAEIMTLNEQVQRTKAAWSEESGELNAKIKEMEARFMELEREKGVVEQRATRASGDNEQLNAQLSEKDQRLTDLNQQVQRTKASWSEESGELNAKIKEMEARFMELEREKGIVEQRATRASGDNEQLNAQLSEKDQRLADLNQQVQRTKASWSEESDGLNAKIKEMEARFMELEREKGVVEQRVTKASGDNEQLNAQLSEKDQRLTELNQSMERMREAWTAQETSLRERVRDLERCVDELRADRKEADERFRTEKETLFSMNSIMRDDFDSLKKESEAEKEASAKRLDELRERAAVELRTAQQHLFESCCSGVEYNLQRSRDELQSATSISYPLQLALSDLRVQIDQIAKIDSVCGDEPSSALIRELTVMGHHLSDVVVCSAAAAYTVSIQHFEPVHEQCRKVASEAIDAVKSLREMNFAQVHDSLLPSLRKSIEELESLCEHLPTSTDVESEKVDALLDDEMKRMDAAIQKAVHAIEEIQKKSRATHSGIRLEVNEKILESCNALMAAIVVLVGRSRAMQDEIVAAGRGTASPNEFYKRNHQWTEGLLSAAKAVGVAATVLVQCADGAITGKGKLESLIVASQEIGASTAQLFVSSRVKAERGSQVLSELSTASRAVNSCTANVVATVKSAKQTLTDTEALDFSHLSLHEAKKEEMESQVRVLELEAELVKERTRFSKLRKQHYHLASFTNGENSDSPTDESPR